MPAVGEVSFELERFEWTADDRLHVVGRWNGVRGRRISRPVLTVDAGGRRQRLSGSQDSDEPWSASFAWAGDDIAGAELEIGRSLVVELPAPRRRRRRSGAAAESDLRMQLDELRATVADLRAEQAIAPSEAELRSIAADRDRLAAELEALRGAEAEPDTRLAAERDRLAAELETLRGAEAEPDQQLSAERDRLAAELEALRGADAERERAAGLLAVAEDERDRLQASLEAARAEREAERDRLVADLAALRGTKGERTGEADQELAGLRLAHGSLRAAHEALEDELEELRTVRDERDELAGQVEQLKATGADTEGEKASLGALVRELERAREALSADLAVAREEIARLERGVAERDRSLAETQHDAERRVETERATTTEVHARLATAREEAQKSIVAEAEETEQLRAELERTRAESERQLAAERAEVARLREEMLSSEVDEGADEASRRMVERITRDLDRERATSRSLKRELDTLRSETAEQRRQRSTSTANGTLSMDDPPARGVRTPEGTQRRVDAARVAASQRVPKVPPSPYAVWAVRVVATLLVAAMLVALVVIVNLAT